MKIELDQSSQAVSQLHLSDQQFYGLYKMFDGT